MEPHQEIEALRSELEGLQKELEEANAQLAAWKAEAELMRHKVITCGIIAEGNEHLNPIYQRDGKWDSQQADKVRELRAQLAASNERVKEARNIIQASLEYLPCSPKPCPHCMGAAFLLSTPATKEEKR